MAPSRVLAVAFLQILCLASGQVQPQPESTAKTPTAATAAGGSFDDVVDSLPESSLDAALQGHLQGSKYQTGVFEQNVVALKHIHSDNPPLASRLVEIAIHDVAVRSELQRRQDGGSNATATATATATVTDGTSTTATATATVIRAPTTESSSPQPAETPTTTSVGSVPVTTTSPSTVPVTTTNAGGSPTTSATTSEIVETTSSAATTATVETSAPVSTSAAATTQPSSAPASASASAAASASASASASAAAASASETGSSTGNTPTTTRPNPSGTTSAPLRAAIVTTTDASGQEVVLSDATWGAVITATDARGSTLITTYTPRGVAVSSVVLRTSTLPDGTQSTITSYAIVGADAGATGGATAASATRTRTTNTAAPSLQSGAAVAAAYNQPKELLVLLGGAIGVAYLL